MGESHPTSRLAGDVSAASLAGLPVAHVTIQGLDHLGTVINQVLAAQQMQAVAAQMSAAAALGTLEHLPQDGNSPEDDAALVHAESQIPLAGPTVRDAVDGGVKAPAPSRRRALLGENEEGSGMSDVVEGPARVDYESDDDAQGVSEEAV